MRVIFMGTPDFAAGIFTALYNAGYEIVLCVTQPDRPSGRKKVIKPGPVKAKAESLGIPVYQPLHVRDEEAVRRIGAEKPDIIVVAAFGQIIPEDILNMPKYGCLNVHASLLPAYRGASPIQHAILDGCAETGVTIMRMNAGLDTGDIISESAVKIENDDTAGTLFEKLEKAGAKLLTDTIPHIADGSAVYTPQPEKSTTAYAGMIKKAMGRIAWGNSSAYIERQVRAMNPWPSAYTEFNGKTLKIWKASPVLDDIADKTKPGEFRFPGNGKIYVKTGDGWLSLIEVQLEGRKRMPADDFLRGIRG